MKINLEIIKTLKPCQNRLDNFVKYYPNFSGDISKFFRLTEITHADKLWVGLRLVSNETKIIFALDCSFSIYAAAYAAAYTADAAAYAAAYAAAAADYAADAATNAADAADYAAAYAAAYKKEQENQLKVLLYLIKGEKK